MNHSKPTPNSGQRQARLAATLSAVVMTAACVTEAKSPPEPTPPQVSAVIAEERNLPREATFTGRVEAPRTVELRPRVSGALDQVLFREGGLVRKGDPLFRLDQRPFAIALRRAEAEVATIQAQLDRANEELERARKLATRDAVSVEELERRQAEAAAHAGRLDSAKAAVAEAALLLDFTTVRAPVDGRIGRAEVTAGNLVSDGTDGTRLAVLNSTNPLHVYFDLDPTTAARASVNPRGEWSAIIQPLEGGKAVRGPIDFVDNGVGALTGTLKVRALVSNPHGQILPGSVVKVVFRYGTTERAVVVPEHAIGTDQGARYVLVAGEGGGLEYRSVTLGTRSGGWREVTDTIRPGDRVVLPGLPGLRPGLKVTPVIEVRQ